MDLETNLKHVMEGIEESKLISPFKRNVELIAVSKTHSIQMIKEVRDLGIKNFGENKVQELTGKIEEIQDVNFHLIGNLQTNKVKYIYDKVKLIQSLDRIKLAKEINKRALKDEIKINCLVQINIGDEDSKFGIKYNETEDFIYQLQDFENLNILGLMAIAPHTSDEALLRKCFEKMNNMFENLKSMRYSNVDMKYLSMGMSNDYKIAIEEGSNMVRIGSKIFGNRNYN